MGGLSVQDYDQDWEDDLYYDDDYAPDYDPSRLQCLVFRIRGVLKWRVERLFWCVRPSTWRKCANCGHRGYRKFAYGMKRRCNYCDIPF